MAGWRPQELPEPYRSMSDPAKAVRICSIVREDESVGLLEPTTAQLKVEEAITEYPWVWVNKYRQAKITTYMVLRLMCEVMYAPAVQGVLIAEKEATAKMAWRRASFAYNALPEKLRVPAALAKSEMEFAHKGVVSVLSGQSGTPAIGMSTDRMVITEYNEIEDQQLFNMHVFPGINKRPHAKVRSEATPGKFGTPGHAMWLRSLEGRGRFRPLQLLWYLDPTCVAPLGVGGIQPTQEELRLIERCPGITLEHLMFRRLALDTEFDENVLLFEHKYPTDEYSGWLVGEHTTIPPEVLQDSIDRAIRVQLGSKMVTWLEPVPEPERNRYLVVADPAGYGGAKGDPSAMTIWDIPYRKQIGVMSARMAPDDFAHVVLGVQKTLNADVVVESNKGECLTALRVLGCKNLYYEAEGHPGIYMTEEKRSDGVTHLVMDLRNDHIHIRDLSTLHQLLAWDGKARRTGKGQGRHHFDLAMTVVLAERMFKTKYKNIVPRLPKGEAGGRMTWKDLRWAFRQRRPQNVLGVL